MSRFPFIFGFPAWLIWEPTEWATLLGSADSPKILGCFCLLGKKANAVGSLCWPGIICLQLYLAAGKPKNGLSAERESPKTGIKPLGTVGLGWKQKRKFCLFKKWKKPYENKQTKKKIPMINKWTNQPNSTNQKNPGFNPSKLLHTEYAALLHRERESVEKGNPIKLGNLCTK